MHNAFQYYLPADFIVERKFIQGTTVLGIDALKEFSYLTVDKNFSTTPQKNLSNLNRSLTTNESTTISETLSN